LAYSIQKDISFRQLHIINKWSSMAQFDFSTMRRIYTSVKADGRLSARILKHSNAITLICNQNPVKVFSCHGLFLLARFIYFAY